MKQVPYDLILSSYRFILLVRLSTLADQYRSWVSAEQVFGAVAGELLSIWEV